MQRSYSIAAARSKLAEIIDEVERGEGELQQYIEDHSRSQTPRRA